jgi:ankyrin repeat protein
MTALMCAAQTGQARIVQCLLAAEADVAAKASSGETALRIARKKRFTKIVSQLIAAGARE